MLDRLAMLAFAVGLIVLGAVYGYFAAVQGWWPHAWALDARIAFNNLRVHWRNDFMIEPTRQLTPAKHEGEGVTVADTDRMAAGTTFITGFFEDKVAARLLAPDGTVLNEWPVHFTKLWPDPAVLEDDGPPPVTDWNVFLHGSMALPDGSIIVNFDTGQSLVRLDRCGEVMWQSPKAFHHVLTMADDGRLWGVLGPDEIASVDPETGELLEQISVKEVFEQNDTIGAFYIPSTTESRSHANDVEVLPASIADAFPLFEAGDVMYSMRDLNAVVVFEPESGQIRWVQHGPWLRQHDPDFLPDGRISVFDNRTDRNASRIVVIDPVTRRHETLYEGSDSRPFYTKHRGMHQHLENGNVLIAEAQSGRAVEVTPDGEIAWEFINRYDEERVAVISNAVRYPPGYFEVDDWSCPTS